VGLAKLKAQIAPILSGRPKITSRFTERAG
jgi:hypothetical protein